MSNIHDKISDIILIHNRTGIKLQFITVTYKRSKDFKEIVANSFKVNIIDDRKFIDRIKDGTCRKIFKSIRFASHILGRESTINLILNSYRNANDNIFRISITTNPDDIETNLMIMNELDL